MSADDILVIGGYEPGHAPTVVRQLAWAWGSCPCGWKSERHDRDSLRPDVEVATHGRSAVLITGELPHGE
jgi:hypothetical protein